MRGSEALNPMISRSKLDSSLDVTASQDTHASPHTLVLSLSLFNKKDKGLFQNQVAEAYKDELLCIFKMGFF